MSIPPDKVKEIWEYAWNYFQMHATQRISVFNFFVVLAALMTSGLVTTFGLNLQAHLLGIAIGVLLMMISFVFWKLDQRTRFLIKNSENALKIIEETFPVPHCQDTPHEVQLFKLEEYKTDKIKTTRPGWFWRRQLSYSESLNLVYLLFGSFGFIGVIISILVFCAK